MTQEIDFAADPAQTTDGFADQSANAENASDSEVVLEIGNRKFTKSDLIKKITSADDFIETLKKEREEDRKARQALEEKLLKAAKVDEVIKKMEQANNGNTNSDSTKLDAETLAKTVEERVAQKLKESEAQKQQQANWDQVQKSLSGAYGSKDVVNAKVDQVAAETGMSRSDLANLAKTNPQVFLRLFPEVVAKKPSVTNITGASARVNSDQSGKAAQGIKAATQEYHKARTTKDRVAAMEKFKQQFLANNS
jgi:hypothetical protein